MACTMAEHEIERDKVPVFYNMELVARQGWQHTADSYMEVRNVSRKFY